MDLHHLQRIIRSHLGVQGGSMMASQLQPVQFQDQHRQFLPLGVHGPPDRQLQRQRSSHSCPWPYCKQQVGKLASWPALAYCIPVLQHAFPSNNDIRVSNQLCCSLNDSSPRAVAASRAAKISDSAQAFTYPRFSTTSPTMPPHHWPWFDVPGGALVPPRLVEWRMRCILSTVPPRTRTAR